LLRPLEGITAYSSVLEAIADFTAWGGGQERRRRGAGGRRRVKEKMKGQGFPTRQNGLVLGSKYTVSFKHTDWEYGKGYFG
jgi:hypothetical protein